MTRKELLDKIANEQGQFLGYLRGRWQDEKEFEDFQDYRDAMKKRLEAYPGVEFVTMGKRPFKVTFHVTGSDATETCILSATSREISWGSYGKKLDV